MPLSSTIYVALTASQKRITGLTAVLKSDSSPRASKSSLFKWFATACLCLRDTRLQMLTYEAGHVLFFNDLPGRSV